MRPSITMKSFLGNLIFFSILLLIIVRFLSVWSGTAFPVNLISAGSMSPSLMEGDIIAWVPINADQVKEGDVIVFKSWISWPEERFIVHRVVEVRTSFGRPAFITKGDANEFTDQAGPHIVEPFVTERNLVGKVLSVGDIPLKIPLIGLVGIWANEGFKTIAQPSAAKGSLDYVGVFTPLAIAVVLLVISLFILPEKTRSIKEKIRFYIFGIRAFNIKKLFVSFLILYVVLLSFIHCFAYDSTPATLGVGEFPEESSFKFGSIVPGQTTQPRNLPVFNPSILPVKGIILGGQELSPFIDRSLFRLGPGDSKTIPITATADEHTTIGSYAGPIIVYSSPLWFLIPDEILISINLGSVPLTIFCIDFLTAVLLTGLTVFLLTTVEYTTQAYTRWAIDRSWTHRARLLFKQSIWKYLIKRGGKIKHAAREKFGWVLSQNLTIKDIQKPLLASLICIPLIFLISSELLVMIIASITAGVVAFFISCKQRRYIVLAALIPTLVISIIAILRIQYHLFIHNTDYITILSLGIGAVAIYLLALSFFLLPLTLISWYLTRQLRNLKEQKDPLLILEGRCDL